MYYCTVPVEKEATLFGPESFCCALYSGSDPAAMQQEKEISAKWTTADKSRYYLLSYVGLATWNGKLVYNTQNTLHIYDPATGQDQTILLSIPANMSVYGIYRITASGEVTYVMDTKDISGYAIYPTYQIA